MVNRPLKISIKAILIGILVDICGSTLVGFVFGFILAVVLITQGVPRIDAQTQVNSIIQNPSFLVGGLFMGLGFTFLGAFVAAHIAKTAEFIHAGSVGAIICLLSLLFPSRPLPVWYSRVGFLLTVPVAILAGYLAKNKNNNTPIR